MTEPIGNQHERLWQRIAAELRFEGDDRFEHRPIELLGASHDSATSGPAQALATFVYAHYYLGRPAASAVNHRMTMGIPIVLREDPDFGAALRAANRGRGWVEPGWRVTSLRAAKVVVRKKGISLAARAEDLATSGPWLIGDEVALRFPNERPYAYPDYYMAVGDAGPTSTEEGRRIVRIYFNVGPQGAAALLSALTSSMGAELGRFCVKVLNHPASFPRADAAVAYVLRDDFPRALEHLGEIVRELGGAMNASVPAFTHAVAPGVAVAEQPVSQCGRPISFGQHRSALVARGLMKAHCDGASTSAERLRWILRELESAGVDPARPYLDAGSTDLFDDDEPSQETKALCGH